MNPTVTSKPRETQYHKPSGWLGRLVARNMNSRHSKLTDWGLSQLVVQKHNAMLDVGRGAGRTDWGLSKLAVQEHNAMLDVGCGGGRTVWKLAAMARHARVFGLDYSKASVAVASRINRKFIDQGRVQISEGSVSQIPFAAEMFDLVTAIETHFWWPDLPGDMREVWRVLKPGGTLAVIAEVYRGANTATARVVEKFLPMTGMNFLTVDEHRELFVNAGYSEIQITLESGKGWICCIGKKL